jgi:hypothetical protein
MLFDFKCKWGSSFFLDRLEVFGSIRNLALVQSAFKENCASIFIPLTYYERHGFREYCIQLS